jgi:hypothetical protein
MKSVICSSILLLGLGLGQLLEARVRHDDVLPFLGDARTGSFQLAMSGKQFLFEEDSSRSEAAFSMTLGVSPHWSINLSLPFMMESQQDYSKSGQGDISAGIAWHNDLRSLPGINIGIRQTATVPSGYRKELAGFPSWTSRRVQWESLAHVEYLGLPENPSALSLQAYGGVRTDDNNENTVMIWGSGLRYRFLNQLAFLETELGQEIRTDDKSSSFLFSAGLGAKLPFGLQFRTGIEQRLLYGLDRVGIYAGLVWTRTPPIEVRVRNRYLREPVLRRLRDRNEIPGFSLEPGAPELLKRAGRLPYLPLRVALLPLGEKQDLAGDWVFPALRQAIEQDTSLVVISHETVRQALAQRHLEPGQSADWVNQLGQLLGADYILTVDLSRHEPWSEQRFNLVGLLRRSRPQAELEAMVRLHEVDGAGPPLTATLGSRSHGRERLEWLPKDHLARGMPDPAERSRLNQRLLDEWCERTRERLFYETSEQVLIQ